MTPESSAMVIRNALLRSGRTCGLRSFRAVTSPLPPRSSVVVKMKMVMTLSGFEAAAGAVLRSPAIGARFFASAQRRLPERLLIYHAGTPRTTFLACLKVTTLFGLAFFTFLVGPAYIAAEKPWWQVAGIAVCGVVPFCLVAYTTAPFVAFVHLRLPPFARHPDRELLRRFVHKLPPATLLDFTTMNLVGRPRITTVALGDLAPAHERLGIVNVKRTVQLSPGLTSAPGLFLRSYPWIRLPPTTRFGAPSAGNSRGTPEAWAWDAVLDTLKRQQAEAAATPTSPRSPATRR
ncbi:hypothetical protein CMQ_1979 [Grosmannia clavigera kw1407]|uniref:Uncharacterized protein n=1 Tax=Grosmannia clavigera (strain kw1407 / UAMH 11150) TaxID=655863 RepID=F0XN12_GROCL|nr:uncharacterized protein CMQ_1979 [Grosmannia clavigera kw1407]EFX00898.1 hypothetical protein CMQ_1979 [Grosmannia clavigera kw1407]